MSISFLDLSFNSFDLFSCFNKFLDVVLVNAIFRAVFKCTNVIFKPFIACFNRILVNKFIADNTVIFLFSWRIWFYSFLWSLLDWTLMICLANSRIMSFYIFIIIRAKLSKHLFIFFIIFVFLYTKCLYLLLNCLYSFLNSGFMIWWRRILIST